MNQPAAKNALSDAEVMDLGNQAAAALKSPIFALIYDKLCREYYLDWQRAPADHTKEMAFLKAKHLALQDVFSDLTNLVAHAERLYAEMQTRNSPDAREARRLDTQGFGLKFDDQGRPTS